MQATTMPPEHPDRAVPAKPLERLVLIGFMGAGKSTLGPILAERLGWRFFDSDRELESKTKTTISELFASLGESVFRHLEAKTVARLLDHKESVISLGGGAIETQETRSLLSSFPNTCVVYLRAPLEILIDRCERQPNASERPVLRQREALRQRFQGRLPHYEAAHLKIDTEALDPEAVAERLLQQMLDHSYVVPLAQKATTV